MIYSLLGGVLLLLGRRALLAGAQRHPALVLPRAGISLQPSELAKLALIPFLAYQIERRRERVNHASFLLPAASFTVLAAALILIEPDMGTAVLLGATVFLMIFLAGLSWRYIVAALALVPPLLDRAWCCMEPYRRERLFAFLDPEKDPLGSGFQALQSLIAVGSGGVFGLGAGQERAEALLPAASGVGLHLLDRRRGAGDDRRARRGRRLRRARLARPAGRARAPDAFGRYLGWGFTGVLVIQALINVSVTIALLPTKGIPLPFISYGGSSLVVTLCACGVLLNVSQHG